MKIEKMFKFEAAHCLDSHSGKCNNLHGHSYRLMIQVEGDLVRDDKSSEGMVIDFADLASKIKVRVINKLDHSFIYNSNNKNEKRIASMLQEMNKKTYPLKNRSTVENICSEVVKQLQNKDKVELQMVRLFETTNNSATWEA